jgi:hypothetical protein
MSESFKRRLGEFTTLIEERAKLAIRGTARELYNEMSSGGQFSPGTPIDTGFHRWHWDASVGAIPAGGNAGSEGAAAERVEGAIADFDVGDTLFITNNGPAIRRLEFDAWSTQAPDGFVRPAIEAGPQIVEKVVASVVAG